MGLVEILQNKRDACIDDNEAILVLLLGKLVATRPHVLREQSRMADRTFWRVLRRLEDNGWMESTRMESRARGSRRGKLTVCQLTVAGEALARKLFEKSPEFTAAPDDDLLANLMASKRAAVKPGGSYLSQ